MESKLAFFLSFLAGMAALELLFFQLASRYNIVDRPNERSMHTKPVYRGGGVIFPVAFIAYGLLSGAAAWWVMAGLVLVAVFSFWDDLQGLPSRWRFLVQLLAVCAVAWQLQLLEVWGAWVLLALPVLLGAVNAYNFMDGINGITVAYSAVLLLTLAWVNVELVPVFPDSLLLALGAAVLVFGFFNFRNKARCFAGDVGSVSLALIVLYLLLQLAVATGTLVWIFLLTLYGIDTIFTIVQRLYLRQNIFQAHKLHLFQLAVYEGGLSHLQVSSLYAGLQAVYNVGLIWLWMHFGGAPFWLILAGWTLLFAVTYVGIKRRLWLRWRAK